MQPADVADVESVILEGAKPQECPPRPEPPARRPPFSGGTRRGGTGGAGGMAAAAKEDTVPVLANGVAQERPASALGSCRAVIGQWYLGQRSIPDGDLRRSNTFQSQEQASTGRTELPPVPRAGTTGAASSSAAQISLAGQVSQLMDLTRHLEAQQQHSQELHEQMLMRCFRQQEYTLLEAVKSAFREQRDWQIEEHRLLMDVVRQQFRSVSPAMGPAPSVGHMGTATWLGQALGQSAAPSLLHVHSEQPVRVVSSSMSESPALRQTSESTNDPIRNDSFAPKEMDSPGKRLASMPDMPQAAPGIGKHITGVTAASVSASTVGSLQEQMRQQWMGDHVAADCHKIFRCLFEWDHGAKRKPKPPGPLGEMVNSTPFTGMVLLVVMLNAAWIGYQTQISVGNALKEPRKEDPFWFRVVNLSFAGVYCLELLIRLAALRSAFFFSIDWNWNMYDVLVVLLLAFEEVFRLNFSVLRMLRLIRLLRVVRIIRILRALTGLRQLLSALAMTLSTLMWYFLALLLFTFVFAVLLMEGVSESIQDSTPPEIRDQLETHFGSLASTMYSLYLAVTGGYPWRDLVDPLADLSGWWRVVFSAYIFFMFFGVLNVFTGIIVFQTNEAKQRDRDIARHARHVKHEDFEAHLRGYFHDWGAVDKEGNVSLEDFQKVVWALDIEAFLNEFDIAVPDTLHIFMSLDRENNGHGHVSLDEIIVECSKIRSRARNSDMQTLADSMRKLREKLQETSDQVVGSTRAMAMQTKEVMLEVGDLRLIVMDKLGSATRPGPADNADSEAL